MREAVVTLGCTLSPFCVVAQQLRHTKLLLAKGACPPPHPRRRAVTYTPRRAPCSFRLGAAPGEPSPLTPPYLRPLLPPQPTVAAGARAGACAALCSAPQPPSLRFIWRTKPAMPSHHPPRATPPARGPTVGIPCVHPPHTHSNIPPPCASVTVTPPFVTRGHTRAEQQASKAAARRPPEGLVRPYNEYSPPSGQLNMMLIMVERPTPQPCTSVLQVGVLVLQAHSSRQPP